GVETLVAANVRADLARSEVVLADLLVAALADDGALRPYDTAAASAVDRTAGLAGDGLAARAGSGAVFVDDVAGVARRHGGERLRARGTGRRVDLARREVERELDLTGGGLLVLAARTLDADGDAAARALDDE